MPNQYRVVCPKCGKAANVPVGPQYTCSCGSVNATPQGGLLYIYRMGNFVGAAIGMSIYLNENPVGAIANKETVCIPLGYGTYKLHMAHGPSRKCNDPVFEISAANPVVYMKAHIKPGAFTNTILIDPCAASEMPGV
ncbi:MAG: hypothetical protein IKH67_01950 [Lachnospiraceae bacterium]|nr:hypothetical protein [Lachnospiraceae bacterium]MBR3003816.1 hypothetical protein [Lachnospiraceae bacterium]MBR6349442.1 hypothetical protein [Lachnospiraceae bacterium]